MTKSIIFTSALGVLLAISPLGITHARSIISFKIEDVGSTVLAAGAVAESCGGTDNLGCEYVATLDGIAANFGFVTLNPVTPAGIAWSGDAGNGTIDFAVENPVNSFTNGFPFFGMPFAPFVSGPSSGSLSGDLILTIDAFPFGGTFNGSADFYLPPDAGTLMVHWVIPTADPTQFLVSLQFEHLITAEEDPGFANFLARWMMEGTITVAALVSDPTSNDGAVVPAIGLTVLTDDSALISAGIVQDEVMETVCNPDCIDFLAPINSGIATVVIPLSAAIPADNVYRVYVDGGWLDFNTLGGDALASAPGIQGECPLPGDASYISPVTAGDFCLQLSILDGGPNDGDVVAGLVSHLGGFAKPMPEVVLPAEAEAIGDATSNATTSDSGSTNLWFSLGVLSVLRLLRRQSRY